MTAIDKAEHAMKELGLTLWSPEVDKDRARREYEEMKHWLARVDMPVQD